MFTFYCIIFSKLSKNKSRKLLVLFLMPYFFYCQTTSGNFNYQHFYGGSAPRTGAHRGRHLVPLNRAYNGQRGRPLPAKLAGHRKQKIYCLGGNFKFSGYAAHHYKAILALASNYLMISNNVFIYWTKAKPGR